MFIFYELDLRRVKTEGAKLLELIGDCVLVLQGLSDLEELSRVLSCCLAILDICAKCYKELDVSSGDFPVPKQPPSPSHYFQPPNAVRVPMLEKLGQLVELPVIMQKFVTAGEALEKLIPHVGEDHLRISAALRYIRLQVVGDLGEPVCCCACEAII